jgi:hypothetical protein
VIPGNHDIPYTFPARFTRPFAEFERQWDRAEPVHDSDGLSSSASTPSGPGGTSRVGSQLADRRARELLARRRRER